MIFGNENVIQMKRSKPLLQQGRMVITIEERDLMSDVSNVNLRFEQEQQISCKYVS